MVTAKNPPRILHVPADVGGNALGLSRAERQLGLRSDVAVLAAGPFGYDADVRVELDGKRLWQKLVARTTLLARALREYDIIHFNFGQSLIPIRVHGHVLNELPLIKRAGKTILVSVARGGGKSKRSSPTASSGCHASRRTASTPFARRGPRRPAAPCGSSRGRRPPP